MNTEKTVRKQAKKVLEGNRSVIISEVMVAVLAFLTGLFAFSLAMSVAGLYDVKNPNQTQQMLTMIFGLVFFAFVVVCLPLINGVYRSVCNVVRGRECSPLDVFYYYKKPKLFFKSVILDVISVGLFFIISGLLNVFNYLSAVSDKIIRQFTLTHGGCGCIACFGVYRQHCGCCGVLHYFCSLYIFGLRF